MRRLPAAMILLLASAALPSDLLATKPLDINTASTDQLRALPGIGTAFSKKIIKGRPYKHRYDLVQKHVLPRDIYDRIRDYVVAKDDREILAP
jgi:competence protein ComEA